MSSGPLVERAPASFEVGLNGLDFSAAGFVFQYHGAPLVLDAMPADGPEAGGTIVRVRGHHLDAGAGYECRFGATQTHATYEAPSGAHDGADRGVVLCRSPPLADAAPAVLLTNFSRLVPFGVSLNGQDFGAGPDFRYHAPLTLSAILPSTGPIGGGIRINISGAGLGGGSAYMCCIVAEAQPCVETDGRVPFATATYDAVHGHMQCHAPRVYNDPGAYQVRIDRPRSPSTALDRPRPPSTALGRRCAWRSTASSTAQRSARRSASGRSTTSTTLPRSRRLPHRWPHGCPFTATDRHQPPPIATLTTTACLHLPLLTPAYHHLPPPCGRGRAGPTAFIVTSIKTQLPFGDLIAS